jgi:hypothetical protein
MEKTCKDCKYWGGFDKKTKGVYFCKKLKCYFLDTEFICSDFIKSEQKNMNPTSLRQKTINFMLDYLPDVKKIIHNYPATVLIFKNGLKSVVKCEQDHDLEKAVLYAWVKHHKRRKNVGWSDTVDLPTLGAVVTELVNFDNMRGKWYRIGYKCDS